MIAKVTRGWDSVRLVSSLMGLGTVGQHTHPTVIAVWDGNPVGLQPSTVGPGDVDFDADELSNLVGHLHAPADAVGFPRRQPTPGEPFYAERGYVWHVMIAVEAAAGLLGLDTWAQIARDVMDRTGIDQAWCRWLAIHHGLTTSGSDHIHVVASLVRQNDGSRFNPSFDYFAVRAVSRQWERHLGLQETGHGPAIPPGGLS